MVTATRTRTPRIDTQTNSSPVHPRLNPATRIDHAKLWSVGALHMAQHFPATFVGSAIPAVFRQAGLPLEMFWLLQLPSIPPALKWLMAIVVDNVGSVRFGYRKSWVVPCTAVGAALYLSLAAVQPAIEPNLATVYLIVAVLFVKSTVMAAQDVAVDAMAAECMTDAERPVGTAIIVSLVFVGTIVGQGLLAVIDQFGWSVTMVTAASLLIIAATPATLRREPPPPRAAIERRARGEKASLLKFLRRPETRFILPFLLALGIGSNFTRVLIPVFLVDLGHSLTSIGLITVVAIGLGTGASAALSPALTRKYGLKKLAQICLWGFPIEAVAFAWMATVEGGPAIWQMAILLGLIIFVSTIYTMAVNNSRFRWTSKAQAGTDYSFQSSLWNLGVWLGGTAAGFAAAGLGWAWFFVVAMGINAVGAMIYIGMFDRVERFVREREAWEVSNSN